MIKSEAKAEYKAPKLEAFGSVRNLTGGSTGRNNDGGGTRRV
ncbi:MAG: lasso RiPP family leader peptide-containing protein [Porphyrobacter sp.]|nr:lasso RiPP family leader peptide-containing protein [Porphyrobacter sp.]